MALTASSGLEATAAASPGAGTAAAICFYTYYTIRMAGTG
jgi:hypothetical protein